MYGEKKIAVLIAAGGSGSRFGTDTPKQFADTDGEPMFIKSARPFMTHKDIDEIIFIVPAKNAEYVAELISSEFHDMPDNKFLNCVTGGDSRQASVKNGLDAVSFESGIVLIHDAARPFVTNAIIDSVIEAACEYGAAVPCVPVTDTIYETTDFEKTIVSNVPDRSLFYAAQTPQGFDFELIRNAHLKAADDSSADTATDDTKVVMKYGEAEVRIVAGDPVNRKITFVDDLSGKCRVGSGFDVHAFAEGRKLILGGVEIPFGRGLLGHSDADVLTHALMDAMLGALALGDIGAFFPDTDEKYRGISSMELLKEVLLLVKEKGWGVVNADLTVIAEKPKIGPYRNEIEVSLASALGIDASRVSVKATTTEGLGFTGREEGIGAQATVLIESEIRE